MIAHGGLDNWIELELDIKTEPERSYFGVQFKHTYQPKNLDFQQAADYTAQIIAERYDNLYLGLSGGLDSEFVAEVFYRNKIPFTPIVGISSYNNDHCYALNWCRLHQITPVVFDFDDYQEQYFLAGAEFVKQNRIYAHGISLVLLLNNIVKEKQGHLVVGEPSLPQLTVSYGEPITDTFDMYYFQFGLEFSRANAPGAFFSYTPEILLAQARELDITLDDSSAKSDLYQIPYRPKISSDDYRVVSQHIVDRYGYLFSLDQYNNPKHYTWTKAQLINLLENKT